MGNNVGKIDDNQTNQINDLFDQDPTLWMSEVEIILSKVADQAATNALMEVEATDEDITDQVHELALQWAKEHAAELVGKRIQPNGDIIDNPDIEWSISESTREDILDLIATSEEDGWSNQMLADAIGEETAFSDSRSEMIARTELRMADVQGNLIGWKESGVVEYKQWLLSDNHDVPDLCDENSDLGPIPMDDEFIDSDPPAHPNAVLEGHIFASYGNTNQMVRSSYSGSAIRIFAIIVDSKISENERQAPSRNLSRFNNISFRNIVFKKLSRLFNLFKGDNARMSASVIPDRIELTIGPNHPVLTRRGFVNANLLQEGDEILYDVRMKSSLLDSTSKPNLEKMPLVEEAFNSFMSFFGNVIISRARNYFHGDETFCYGEVDIVRPQGNLLAKLDSGGIEHLSKCNLSRSYPTSIHVSGCRSCSKRFDSLFSAISGDMSGCDPSYPLFRNKSLPMPFKIFRIISCHKTSFKGLAFDASTETGLYNIGGIVVKNCECSLVAFSADAVSEGAVDEAFAVMEEAEKMEKGIIDDLAHQAATSPRNDLSLPSKEQIHSGNYKKGHLTISGIEIAIENPAGSSRKPEYPPLKAHYGYVKGVEGKDGDALDIFVRPDTSPEYEGKIYIINQKKEDGTFDEHKVMIGYPTELEAFLGYLENYRPGWDGIDSITEMTVDQFKNWIYDGKSKTSPVIPERS